MTSLGGLFRRAINLYRSEGLFEFLRRTVVFIAPGSWFPVSYNGVQVTANRARPNYESGIILAINENVVPGDRVVIVGGGYGVTAVKNAQKVGSSGSTVVFEGSADAIARLEKTLTLNEASDAVEVRHAVVGPAISVTNSDADSEGSNLTPEELPECDVLELDCEGAEIEILKNMEIEPRIIIVESHGIAGAPSKQVEELLIKKSYEILSKDVADRDKLKLCKRHDVYVITARKAV